MLLLLLHLEWVHVLQLHLFSPHTIILHQTIIVHFPEENTLIFMQKLMITFCLK